MLSTIIISQEYISCFSLGLLFLNYKLYRVLLTFLICKVIFHELDSIYSLQFADVHWAKVCSYIGQYQLAISSVICKIIYLSEPICYLTDIYDCHLYPGVCPDAF